MSKVTYFKDAEIDDEAEVIDLIDKLIDRINRSNSRLCNTVDHHKLIASLTVTKSDIYSIIGSKVLVNRQVITGIDS